MKASAREQHAKDVEAKAKPKRKRGKTAAVAEQPAAEPAAAAPPSPERVAKKVKGVGEEETGDDPGEKGDGPSEKSDDKLDTKKTPKTKRPEPAAVKAAWGIKE